MKVAIVHDWISKYGGAERVLNDIYECFPQADIFTLVLDRNEIKNTSLEKAKFSLSFVQKLPFGLKYYRKYLMLYPLAIEKIDLTGYDLIISSSHAVAKGVLTQPGQLHISYCNNIMLYAWDQFHYYLKEEKLNKGIKGIVANLFLHYIRNWDYAASQRPDYYISNSIYQAKRLKKIFKVESDAVIYPAADTELFKVNQQKEDFYLVVARFVPWKMVDVIVKAFAQLPEKRLVVLGDGPESKKIRSFATSNISFLGFVGSKVVNEYLGKAKALISLSSEPFGISLVEAQACGTPVISYFLGGAAEIIIPGKTGLFVRKQTEEALRDTIKDFEIQQGDFDPVLISDHARKFSRSRFKLEFRNYVLEKYTEFIKELNPNF